LGGFGVGEGEGQTRAVGFAGFPVGGDRGFGGEFEDGAVGCLEGDVKGAGGFLSACEGPGQGLGVAVGGIEGEVFVVDGRVDCLLLRRWLGSELRAFGVSQWYWGARQAVG